MSSLLHVPLCDEAPVWLSTLQCAGFGFQTSLFYLHPDCQCCWYSHAQQGLYCRHSHDSGSCVLAGVPAAHVHRLLLGLSTSGRDMRPLLQVAGSCVAALQSSSGKLHALTCVSTLQPHMWPHTSV
jgi:hypothetical protein